MSQANWYTSIVVHSQGVCELKMYFNTIMLSNQHAMNSISKHDNQRKLIAEKWNIWNKWNTCLANFIFNRHGWKSKLEYKGGRILRVVCDVCNYHVFSLDFTTGKGQAKCKASCMDDPIYISHLIHTSGVPEPILSEKINKNILIDVLSSGNEDDLPDDIILARRLMRISYSLLASFTPSSVPSSKRQKTKA